MMTRVICFAAATLLAALIGCTNYDGGFGKLVVVSAPASQEGRKLASTQDQNAAQAVFRAFLGCQSEYDPENSASLQPFRKCTDRFFSTQLGEVVKKGYAAWLFKHMRITEPRPCSEEDDGFLKSFGGFPKLVLCFDAHRTGAQTKGYIFFSRHKDRFVIKEIKF